MPGIKIQNDSSATLDQVRLQLDQLGRFIENVLVARTESSGSTGYRALLKSIEAKIDLIEDSIACDAPTSSTPTISRELTAERAKASEPSSNPEPSASPAILTSLIDETSNPIYVRTHDRRLVMVNKAFCELHGLSRSETIGQVTDSLLANAEGRGLLDVDLQADAVKSGAQVRRDILLPDGQLKTFAVAESASQSSELRQLCDVTGSQPLYVGTAHDLSKENHLQSRLDKLTGIFDHVGDGILVLTDDGRIHESNLQFSEIVNQPASELAGRELVQALGPEFEILRLHLAEVVDGGQWSGSLLLTLAGRSRWLWVSMSAIETTDALDEGRVVALFSDVTALKGTQHRLKHQSRHDHLTGLPNRRFFRQIVCERIRDAQENDVTFAICFLDLDDFKRVNDTVGHDAGDQLLRAVTHRLKSSLRGNDFIARFGGDEFAVLLWDIDPNQLGLEVSCGRIVKSICEPFMVGNEQVTIGASVGATIFPDHAEKPDLLMQYADIAMYEAKSAGKNQMRIFSPAMQTQVDLRHRMQNSLRRAVAEREFSLVYQPKLRVATGEPYGCEALARWTQPDGTTVSPERFIDIAEQNGQILELGRTLFEMAARQCCEWVERGLNPLPMALNVSQRQLRHRAFVPQLVAILEETGAKAEWFELEIAENDVVDNIYHAIETINQLHEMGFRVAMDDFGTGYSSLVYLKSFPIDTLKIDISFIREVAMDSRSEAIARTIISLGQGLGLSTAAEGVETVEQLKWLQENDCEIYQGFYSSHPLAADAYERWLRDASANVNDNSPNMASSTKPLT